MTEARKRRGLTLQQLGDIVGMNKGDLSRIENGIVHPTAAQLEKIEAALNEHIRLWIPVEPR